jgi:hypothetical protein
MKKIQLGLLFVVLAIFGFMACDTSLSVGRKTVGIRSGGFVYTDGYLRGTYSYHFEKVWSASIKALLDLNAEEGEQERKIATGKLTALIQGDKVRVLVNYVDKETTSVSVMAGSSGNALASQFIHERIAAILKNL